MFSIQHHNNNNNNNIKTTTLNLFSDLIADIFLATASAHSGTVGCSITGRAIGIVFSSLFFSSTTNKL
jgi:Co/Zn/Cd efflux system component